MGDIAFRCPACGTSYSIPAERVPSQGARGTCKSCGSTMTVYPDGRVAGGEPKPPEPAAPPAQAPGVVRFACPSCSKSHEVPASVVPTSGVRGACSGCGATLFVLPDGRVSPQDLSAPPPVPAPDAEPEPPPLRDVAPGASWEIQFEGQVMGPFPFADLKQLVLSDRLPPDRLVRPVGEEWGPAVLFAPLAALYTPAERGEEAGESYGTEESCFSHPQEEPTHRCSQCQRHMCGACLKELPTHDGRKTVAVCPACGAPCVALKKRARWTPFYMDLGQVFVSPFVGSSWILFGALVVMEVLKAWMGCLGFILIGVLQFTFYIHVVKAVGEGSYEMPDWPDRDNWADMMMDVIKVVFVSLVSLIPLLAIGLVIGGGFLNGLMLASRGQMNAGLALGPLALLFLVLAALYVLYLPICVAIVAIFRTVVPALNPYLIGKIIFRIGPPYLYAAGLWVAFTVIRIVLAAFSQRVPGLGMVAPTLLAVYFTLLNAYVLGRVVYENEDRIGWY